MNDIRLLTTASAHQLYGAAFWLASRRGEPDGQKAGAGDRGAVTLEQVLWFVAAGVSVIVIAAILWGQIKTQAETPVKEPVAP